MPNIDDNIPAQHDNTIVLSAADSAIFAEVLLNPPELNEAMKKAFERHKELLNQT